MQVPRRCDYGGGKALVASAAITTYSSSGLRREDENHAGRQVRSPPNTSYGKGTADIDYDSTSKKLNWKLTYSGLSGPVAAAHFHGPAEAGKNARVAVVIPGAASSPTEGSAVLTDAQAADFVAGKYYINVHTQPNPGGEIRGQIPPSPPSPSRVGDPPSPERWHAAAHVVYEINGQDRLSIGYSGIKNSSE